ncbi:MAG: hypothetical protein WBO17_13970 [Sphingorhabdus sp.]
MTGTIAGNQFIRGQSIVSVIGRSESSAKLGFQTLDQLNFGPILVLSNQVAHIFADILIGARIANIGSNEIAMGTINADIEGDA